MSQALRILRRLATKPPAKARMEAVSSCPPETWRLELAMWNEEDRFAWEERVAIMLAAAGLSLEQAEKAAFEDVSLYRDAVR